jgi:hypothetical protein
MKLGKARVARRRQAVEELGKGETLDLMIDLSTGLDGNLTCLFRPRLDKPGSQIPIVGSASIRAWPTAIGLVPFSHRRQHGAAMNNSFAALVSWLLVDARSGLIGRRRTFASLSWLTSLRGHCPVTCNPIPAIDYHWQRSRWLALHQGSCSRWHATDGLT